MEEMLDRIFGNLQRLEIQPTERNVELLADCYGTLRSIYAKVQETAKKGAQGAAEPADVNKDGETEKTPTGAENGEE